MYRVLDLFSGIGGFSLGLERTGGFKTIAFCEIDPYCQKVLKKHWPDVPCHSNITTREFVEGEADVITGGFPCQDLSFAGRGAGLSGSRSGLYHDLIRAICLVRPLYAIVENVAALLSRGLGTVLGDLAEIGYDAEWHCIPASAVGAPHIRDRVWIISKPQHTYPDEPGSHRAQEHNRSTKLRNEQGCLSGPLCEAMANADSSGCAELQGCGEIAKRDGSGTTSGSSLRDRASHEWGVEPNVGRVAYGVPNRVDRLRALGNAVVPQIPELIGRAILQAEVRMT